MIGLAYLAISLGIGVAGFYFFEDLSWIDAFANAAMILSGMGPLSPLTKFDGKLFAELYALFSGVTFITVVGVVLAPIVHPLFHGVDIQIEEDSQQEGFIEGLACLRNQL